MSKSPIPSKLSEVPAFYTNFGNVLVQHGTTFGIVPADMTSHLNDRDYAVHEINIRLSQAKTTAAAEVELKDLLLEGDEAAQWPDPLPGSQVLPAFPTAVPPVAPGIFKRLRKLIQTLKNHRNYTPVLGAQLGIIVSGEATAADVPALTLISAVAPLVTIGWNKDVWDGVKVKGRIPGGAWVDLGTDMFSPWVDTRPLAVPGQAELREYAMCYLDGDTPLAAQSDVLVVTVTPA